MNSKNNRIKKWLKRRNTPDPASMLLPRSYGRLRRKLLNIARRISVFLMAILYRKYRKPEKPSIKKIASVLIIPHDPIGDLVLTSPIWAALRNRNPTLKIGVVSSSRNKDVLMEEKIDRVYDLYSPGLFRIFKEMRLARNEQWDVVLVPAGFYKPSRFAFVSRFITRKGITATMHSSRYRRYSRIYSFCFERLPGGKIISMVEQYQSLIEQVFDISFSPEERYPHFMINNSIAEVTKKRIDTLLHNKSCSRFILIHLEAKVPYREWGMENTSALAEVLNQKWNDVLILLSASPEFRHYYKLDQFEAEHQNMISFETKNIQELATVIQSAEIVIAPDTSVIHIAAAFRKKILAFFPAPDEWLPYGGGTIFYPERWEPISSISVNTVITGLMTLLD